MQKENLKRKKKKNKLTHTKKKTQTKSQQTNNQIKPQQSIPNQQHLRTQGLQRSTKQQKKGIWPEKYLDKKTCPK